MDEKQTISLPGAELEYFEHPQLGQTAQALYEDCYKNIAWKSQTISLFGKTMLQPRLVAWFGDPGADYAYSGQRQEVLAWTECLLALRERVQQLTGSRFNSVLANLYRNERDSMGLHADDEPELGERPVIASLSLGETRTFRLKHRSRRDLKPLKLALPTGSLLVMRGDTQRFWKHEVPKSRVACEPRINLTFRWVGQKPG